MAISKVKINITEKVKNANNRMVNVSSVFTFDTWNGRPQLPKPIIDKTTRLGGEKVVMSIQKTEAITTNATAVIMGETVAALETICSDLQSSIGKRGKWTDENNNVINNFYILDVGYSIRAVYSGTNNAMATLAIACSCDNA